MEKMQPGELFLKVPLSSDGKAKPKKAGEKTV